MTLPNFSHLAKSRKPLRAIRDIENIIKRCGQPVLIPVNYRDKDVKYEGRSSIDFVTSQLPEYQDLLLYTNIGVMMGAVSNDLVCIDCDSQESVAEMEALNSWLSDTLATQGQPGRKTFWLSMKGTYPGVCKKVGDLEWRAGSNGYCLIDGIHPDTNEPYKIVQDCHPKIVSFDKISFPEDMAQKLENSGSRPKLLPSLNSYPIESPIEPPTDPPTFSIGTTIRQEDVLTDEEEMQMFLIDTPGDRVTGERMKYRTHTWGLFQSIRNRIPARAGTRNNSMITFAGTSVTAMCYKLAFQMEALWFMITDKAIGWDLSRDAHMRSFVKQYHKVLATYPLATEIKPEFSSEEIGVYRSLIDEDEQTAFRIIRNLALQMKSREGCEPGVFPMPRRQFAARLLVSEDRAKVIFAVFEEMGVIKLESKGATWVQGKKPAANLWRYLLPTPKNTPLGC